MGSAFKTFDISLSTTMKLMKTDSSRANHRLTPTIATLYDARVTEFDLKAYIENGMRIVGFRLTWIPKEDRIRTLDKIKKATESCCQKYDITSWPIAISIDIPNACICTGFLANDIPVMLTEDSIVEVTCDIKYYSKCDATRIFINDPYTLPTITPGTEITLCFRKIVLVCIEVVNNQTLKCKVTKDGMLDSQEIVCLRGIKLVKPPIQKRDLDLIHFAKEYQIDMIIVSTVRYPTTPSMIRSLFHKCHKPLIISTICEQEGLDNVDDIIEASDGVILAREFLAASLINHNHLLRIQLYVGAKCKLLGKPFYISGSVLEGSVKDGILIGSDMADVTTAIEQGAGFVLRPYDDPQGTATALHLLHNIFTRIVDPSFRHQEELWTLPHHYNMIPVTAALACVQASVLAAKAMSTQVIIVPTVSGKTVRQLSHYSDNFAIIAITSSSRIARQLLLIPGVVSILSEEKRLPNWEDEMVARITCAATYAVRFHVLQFGDSFVVLRKHLPISSYCDRVGIWKVITEEENRRTVVLKIQDNCRFVALRSTTSLIQCLGTASW